jgi:hypothetical protein
MKHALKIYLLVMVSLLSGCNPQDTTHTPEKTITNPVRTYTQTAAFINTETSTPSPTSSFTPTLPPWLAPRITSTPPWTPVPTLPEEEALEKLLEIYRNNGGCELPCVWGVTPGQTTWAEVRDRFSPLGSMTAGRYHPGLITYTFMKDIPLDVDPYEYGIVTIEFHRLLNGDKIEEITVGSLRIASFDPRLFNVLNTFGKPTQIWVKVVPGIMKGDTVAGANYEISLFYPDQGYIIKYMDETLVIGKTIRICPQKNVLRNQSKPALFIFNPNINNDFKDFHFPQNNRHYSMLEEFQNKIDPKTFYEIYRDPNASTCIDIDLETVYDLNVP